MARVGLPLCSYMTAEAEQFGVCRGKFRAEWGLPLTQGHPMALLSGVRN